MPRKIEHSYEQNFKGDLEKSRSRYLQASAFSA